MPDQDRLASSHRVTRRAAAPSVGDRATRAPGGIRERYLRTAAELGAKDQRIRDAPSVREPSDRTVVATRSLVDPLLGGLGGSEIHHCVHMAPWLGFEPGGVQLISGTDTSP